MNKNPKKINLTSDGSLFEKSLNLQKYIEELSSKSINLSDKFSFTWAGKSNAIKSVLIPSKLTLNPKPEESIKWDESDNLFIEGDNLEVLKLLQKAYFEKVKMIYIDPPYNTGHDFVYNDDFSSPLDNYLKQTGQKTENNESTTTNKETNGRFHSDWLSMMYPRLKLAWNLLREDGVIFISIDDNEVHHLRMLMDEIFGEENFVLDIPRVTKKGGKSSDDVAKNHDYILLYKKNKNIGKLNRIEHNDPGFKNKDDHFEERGFFKLNQTLDYDTLGYVNSLDYKIDINGTIFYPGGVSEKEFLQRKKDNPKDEYRWRWSEDLFKFGFKNDFVVVKETKNGKRIYTKTYQLATISENEDGYFVDYQDRDRALSSLDLTENLYSNDNAKKDLKKVLGKAYFDYTKPVSLIKEIILRSTNKDSGDIIMDFFAGSGTTAQALLETNAFDNGNRKFILVQLPEILAKNTKGYLDGYVNVSDITKERIRRVINGYSDNPQPINSGFKLFTLTESNYPENCFVFNPEKSSKENQQLFVTYLNRSKQSQLFDKENDISIVYENIVKEGLSLNSKVEKISIGKNNVYQVTDGEQQLFICLENKLELETVKKLTDKLYKDKLFICLECALDDTMAANLALNLDLKTI